MTCVIKTTIGRQATFVMSLALSLSACGWPVHGQGGMDEAYSYSRESYGARWIGTGPRAEAIGQKLDLTRMQLDALKDAGVKDYFPAQYSIANQLWARTTREFTGGLFADANAKIHQLENLIRSLENTYLQTISATQTDGDDT